MCISVTISFICVNSVFTNSAVHQQPYFNDSWYVKTSFTMVYGGLYLDFRVIGDDWVTAVGTMRVIHTSWFLLQHHTMPRKTFLVLLCMLLWCPGCNSSA